VAFRCSCQAHGTRPSREIGDGPARIPRWGVPSDFPAVLSMGNCCAFLLCPVSHNGLPKSSSQRDTADLIQWRTEWSVYPRAQSWPLRNSWRALHVETHFHHGSAQLHRYHQRSGRLGIALDLHHMSEPLEWRVPCPTPSF
jgi:hypothetical protein